MQTLTFFFAFVAVLALIGVAAWLVRRFAGNRLGANTNRGRMPRLAVIDAAAVDGRRRLVLVRRDNIEHLLMIGGPTDIVVEPNIVRATPARDQMPRRRRGRRRRAAAGLRRCPMPAGAMATAQGPIRGPTCRSRRTANARAAAPGRPSFADEVRRPAAPPLPERRSDPLAGFTPEPPGGRAEPTFAAAGRAPEPMIPRPPRASEAAPKRAAGPRARARTRRRAAAPVPPHRRPRRRSRAPTKISPRWRSGWKPRCAARPAEARRAAGCARTAGRPPARAARLRRRAARAAEERL